MRLSVFLEDCHYLSKPTESVRHGAFLASAAFFKWVANEPAFDKLEVFLPPAVMGDAQVIREAAEHTLEPQSRGRGRLSFYPVHQLPEVWADEVPRVLRSIDPQFMARDRYLRDSCAKGPVALSVDTHIVAEYESWASLRRVLDAPEVAFDSVQCISHSLRDALVSSLNSLGCDTPPFRLDVIPRPVNIERFRPPTLGEKLESRRALRIPDSANVAIFLSRVGPHSKADLYPLVQAFARSSGPNDWLVIGGGPTSDTAYARVKDWLAEAGVLDRARLLGSCPQEEVPQRLWTGDFFVLPCDNPSEGLGIAPVEAMACGLPALVSDWDGMREAVRNGHNGYLVPTYWAPGSSRIAEFSPFNPHLSECLLLSQCVVVDQEVLEQRMRLLFRDEALRERLGIAARESAAAFRPEVIGEKLIRTFSEQLAAAGSERDASKTARKAAACRLGLPSNYDRILKAQATRSLSASDVLELAPSGREVLEGRREFPTYFEVGLLSPPRAMQSALECLADGPRELREVAETIKSDRSEDSIFTVALLLKRGFVRFRKSIG